MSAYYGNNDDYDTSSTATLYKKNGSKVQQWTIEVNEGKYRTSEGFVGGAITTTEWTVAKPKNVGRSNATTGDEQAMIEATAKIKLKGDKGYTTSKDGVVSDFRFEPMLAHKYEDHVKRVVQYLGQRSAVDPSFDELDADVASQPKLDGMRCNIKHFAAYSRAGKPIVSVPHILNALRAVLAANETVILDGELYNHELRDDFNSLISHVKKSKPTKQDTELCALVIEYHVYDMYDSANPDMTFFERQEWITDHLTGIPGIVLVRTDRIFTQDELDACYGEYRDQGYEGQMVRLDCPYEQKRSYCLLKRKEFQDAEYEILDILEGIGNRSGMMGKFILKAGPNDTFESNGLGTHEYYRELLANKEEHIGKMATVRFQNLTPRGVPRFPIVTTIRDYE